MTRTEALIPKRAIAIALLVFSAIYTAIAVGQDHHTAHVLTIGPGPDLFTKFGHIALMIEDRQTGVQKVINFGEFDMNQPNLVYRYALGTLQYRVVLTSYNSLVRGCKAAGRELVVRTLDLREEELRQLEELLKQRTLLEHRNYAYNHFTRNCCTQVRDLIDHVTRGAISRAGTGNGRPYRFWVRQVLADRPAWSLLAQLTLGRSVDAPKTRWHDQFLPEVFSQALDEIRLSPDKRPLVMAKKVVCSGRFWQSQTRNKVVQQGIIAAAFILLWLGLAAPLFWLQQLWSRRLFGTWLVIFGAIAGISGGLLLGLWHGTPHEYWKFNENILVFPATHLVLVILGLCWAFGRNVPRCVQKITLGYLCFSLILIGAALLIKLWGVPQNNNMFVAVGLAVNATALMSVRRYYRATANKITRIFNANC